MSPTSRSASPDAAPSPTSSRSVTQTVNGSHQFVIQSYSLAKGMGFGKYIASDNFSVGGYQWAIFFYPDGKNQEDNSTYVSVFIVLASEGTEVRALFELSLVDQSGKGKHKVLSHFERSLDSGPYTLKYRGSMWGCKRFFRRSMLETSDYLKDDCLKINCKIGVVISETHCPRFRAIHVPASELGLHFGMLLDNMEGSDVTLDVAGEKFQAHKLVLAAQSPYFKSKFFNGPEADNEVVTINDLEPKVFKALLHFMYKDSLPEDVEPVLTQSFDSLELSEISETLVAKLMAAADIYKLDRLRLMCESHICKGLSINSVAKILVIADRYNAVELKGVCLRFAAENLAAVLETEAYEYVKEDCPKLQTELLRAVAGFEDATCSGGKSTSVWAQLSEGGGESISRRVRQRTS
ncbi:PREDICTED: BTB/POZ and MATH domain-containing protein 5-like [Tarenaya hassleriana]|uniref:BTB/POZ and MATH domain-containing protein 5-like n=1 Tax=Tarenaya hassleriana TaxID=28532 RepID=UPI00053C6B89|nr:PREDICTED: BTB/POZ and MATH domain-containing protein 5-like [Tarenaya hassleriana]